MPRAKGKNPCLMLYTGDYLKDPELSACSPATRGAWIDWLCRMQEQVAAGREPVLRGTVAALSRLGRCSESEAVQALGELQENGAAEVEPRFICVSSAFQIVPCNADVTPRVMLRNRRLTREYKSRVSSTLRVQEHRAKQARNGGGNADVTPPLSSSASSSVSATEEKDTPRAASASGPEIPEEIAVLSPIMNRTDLLRLAEIIQGPKVPPSEMRATKLTDKPAVARERLYLLAHLYHRTDHAVRRDPAGVAAEDTAFEIFAEWRIRARKKQKLSVAAKIESDVHALRALLEAPRPRDKTAAARWLLAAAGEAKASGWIKFDVKYLDEKLQSGSVGKGQGSIDVAGMKSATTRRREEMARQRAEAEEKKRRVREADGKE